MCRSIYQKITYIHQNMTNSMLYRLFILCGIFIIKAKGQIDELALGVSDDDFLNIMENFALDTNGRDRVVIDPFDSIIPPPNDLPKPDAMGSCEGKFTEETGRIASPRFPNATYPPNSNCSWEIKVQPGKLIRMKFDYMDIEVGPPECPFDGVLVVDYGKMWDAGVSPHLHGPVAMGVTDPQVPPTALGKKRYCGQESFDPIVSISNAVRIGFYSDSDSQGEGFVLSWDTINKPTEEGDKEEVQYQCNFEEGFCKDWNNVQSSEDTFDWEISSGKTKTLNTGPAVDHTTGKQVGKYAYMEGSKPQKENDTAIFSSPEMKFADGQTNFCVEFWYHMYGSGIGSLVVGVAYGENRNIEWIKSGNQGDKWRRATFGIERLENSFKVMFAGVRGGAYTSDIAIDDITVHSKPCSSLDSDAGEEDRLIEPPVPEHECEGDDYPCMDGVTCIKDAQICDGNPDCPEKDDESDFLCIRDFNVTTAVPPPSETTEDYETYYDETTAYLATTIPSWMLNLTTFEVEITEEIPTEENFVNESTTQILITESTKISFAATTITTDIITTTVGTETTTSRETTEEYTTTQPLEETTEDITTEAGETTTIYLETTAFEKENDTGMITTPQATTTLQSETISTSNPTTTLTDEPGELFTTTTRVEVITTNGGIASSATIATETTSQRSTEAVKEIITSTLPQSTESTKSTDLIETTSQDTYYTTDITSTTTNEVLATTDKVIEKPQKETPGQFTPRPSPKSVKVAITAVAVEPTGVAEKQESDGDGSSAGRVSSLYVIHLVASSMFVLFLNNWR
uniref:zonadhesin-like n=1 Tax=Styela clava TaxID=7725 RepID=UPI00193A61C6|nr:zonadhesin-like [Styela clava]